MILISTWIFASLIVHITFNSFDCFRIFYSTIDNKIRFIALGANVNISLPRIFTFLSGSIVFKNLNG